LVIISDLDFVLDFPFAPGTLGDKGTPPPATDLAPSQMHPLILPPFGYYYSSAC